jgi:hypothetical protein
MATGKGIVASKTGQLSVLLTHEQDALLVEQRNDAQLAEAILRLLGNPELRRQLGEAARRKVMSAYTWEANFQRAVIPRRQGTNVAQQRGNGIWKRERSETRYSMDPQPGPVPKVKIDVGQVDCERIQRAAHAALAQPPVTITKFPASLSDGGPNDFYSNGDYWWPDPTKANGLPYIRRDGQSNPGVFNEHRACLAQLRDAVATLGAAYKITGENCYVTKAIELLRVFFLDPGTRMNPHLKFAQAIPGRSAGRGTGIIDTLHLAEVPLALEAMRSSKVFPPEVLAGLKDWFREYAGWMSTSKNGREEAASTNNHSVAHSLQLAVFARFSGEEARLDECRRRYKEIFVAKQMAPDGSFPAELERTKPYGYSIFQLDNMATLCQFLSHHHDNLWEFALRDGRGIRKAMEFLFPYLLDKSKWPYKPDIQAWDGWPARPVALLFAGLALGELKYLELWKKLQSDPEDAEVRRNIAITQPVLWVE